MTPNQGLMQEASNLVDDEFEEEWIVLMSTKGEYVLSKVQARILQQAIGVGNRGIVMFKTFSIPIPFIAEFYQKRRFLKNVKQLPARASEPEYKPMDPEKFEAWKKEVYKKIGKPIR